MANKRGASGVKLEWNHEHDATQGVRWRKSDKTLILKRLGWEPPSTLEDSLATMYPWIHTQTVSVAA